jgi:hypothetical protein
LEHGIQSSCDLRQHQREQQQQGSSFWHTWHQGIHRARRVFYQTVVLGIFFRPVTKVLATLQRIFLGPWLCLVFIFLGMAEITLHILSIRLPKIHVALKDLSVAGK